MVNAMKEIHKIMCKWRAPSECMSRWGNFSGELNLS